MPFPRSRSRHPSAAKTHRAFGRPGALPALAALYALLAAAPLRAEFSSYSVEGLGLEISRAPARELALGRSGSALVRRQGLSYANPSRNAYNEKTSFDATFASSLTFLADEENSNRMLASEIPLLGLGFRLGGFGHLALAYHQRFVRNFAVTVPAQGSRPQERRDFEGGTTEFNASYAYAPTPRLALGAGYSLLLGRERVIGSADYRALREDTLLDDSRPLYDTSLFRNSGGYPSLSLTLRQGKSSLGASFAFGTALERKESRSVSNLEGREQETETEFDLPWSVRLGFAQLLGTGHALTADYGFSDWREDGLNSAFEVGLGYEFQGGGGIYDAYFRRLAYRAGAGLARLPVQETWEYRGSLGLGFPLGKRNNTLDASLFYALRTPEENILVSENQIGLAVSLIGVGDWGRSVRKRR